MSRKLQLPDAPEAEVDGRMSAPSALRNREVIAQALQRLAPQDGRALEIASGTGEHVIHLAETMPKMIWHPTDLDEARLRSIAAWVSRIGLPNIHPPKHLDAAAAGWAAREVPFDLILTVNLLHLVSDSEAATILTETAQALTPQGVAIIYGPFLRDGIATSEGDARFDASLRAQDPLIGYKDVARVSAQLQAAGLTLTERLEMPANNLMLAFTNPSAPA